MLAINLEKYDVFIFSSAGEVFTETEAEFAGNDPPPKDKVWAMGPEGEGWWQRPLYQMYVKQAEADAELFAQFCVARGCPTIWGPHNFSHANMHDPRTLLRRFLSSSLRPKIVYYTGLTIGDGNWYFCYRQTADESIPYDSTDYDEQCPVIYDQIGPAEFTSWARPCRDSEGPALVVCESANSQRWVEKPSGAFICVAAHKRCHAAVGGGFSGIGSPMTRYLCGLGGDITKLSSPSLIPTDCIIKELPLPFFDTPRFDVLWARSDAERVSDISRGTLSPLDPRSIADALLDVTDSGVPVDVIYLYGAFSLACGLLREATARLVGEKDAIEQDTGTASPDGVVRDRVERPCSARASPRSQLARLSKMLDPESGGGRPRSTLRENECTMPPALTACSDALLRELGKGCCGLLACGAKCMDAEERVSAGHAMVAWVRAVADKGWDDVWEHAWEVLYLFKVPIPFKVWESAWTRRRTKRVTQCAPYVGPKAVALVAMPEAAELSVDTLDQSGAHSILQRLADGLDVADIAFIQVQIAACECITNVPAWPLEEVEATLLLLVTCFGRGLIEAMMPIEKLLFRQDVRKAVVAVNWKRFTDALEVVPLRMKRPDVLLTGFTMMALFPLETGPIVFSRWRGLCYLTAQFDKDSGVQEGLITLGQTVAQVLKKQPLRPLKKRA
eukprot:GEMP01019345.1.p1 GENE.GEMP01019345.1~~GEMP01019345.1.p1  ORF type:complete len:682 (+),score=172.81 GEMP01019345.1:25-2046(+)